MPEIIQLSDYRKDKPKTLVHYDCEIIPRTELVLKRMQKQYNDAMMAYLRLFNPWI